MAGIPESYTAKVIIIVSLMTVSTISAMTGLGRGIRWLSLSNIAIFGVLLLYVPVLGPTMAVASTKRTGLVDFGRALVPMSLATEGPDGDPWTADRIYFFWAWWIAWGPFVGTFIARISRGRSIRGVVTGVVLVPSAVSVVWFSVLGGTALHRETTGVTQVAEIATEATSVATVSVLQTLPFPTFGMALLVPALALLFITSADSASFMLGSSTTGGSLKPKRPIRHVVLCGCLLRGVAAERRGHGFAQRCGRRRRAVHRDPHRALHLLGITVWRDRDQVPKSSAH